MAKSVGLALGVILPRN